MSKTKEETVQQWKESLAESARTAVEALAAITPIDKPAPSTDEASKILGQAMLRIRELVRPKPKTVAFLEEAAWYRMKGAEKPAGEYRTPQAALDAVMANPPLNIPPAAEPIQPGTPQMVEGEEPWRKIPCESCGMIRDGGTIHGWCVRETAMIEVLAKQQYVEGKPTDTWTVTGTVDCEKVLVGSFFCGRNKANQLVRFIRNGLVASRLRLRHKRLNRQAKAAAAAVPAVPTVPTVPTPNEARP